MSQVKLQTHQDLEDFVRGCTLLGVGGGGNPAEGLKALEEQFNAGKALGWVDPEAQPQGTWAACAFLMGSTAHLTEACKPQLRTEAVLKYLGPRHFGVDREYVPIEKVLGATKGPNLLRRCSMRRFRRQRCLNTFWRFEISTTTR